MKNTNMLIIIAIVLAVLAGGAYFLTQQSPKSTDSVDISQSGTEKMMEKTTDSQYIEYSSIALNQAADKRRILFFYASWCPTCRPADATFKANLDKIPKDVVMIRVNYNDPETDAQEKELATKYQVTYQHTFVQIDSDGKEVTKWNGGQIEELLANIK